MSEKGAGFWFGELLCVFKRGTPSQYGGSVTTHLKTICALDWIGFYLESWPFYNTLQCLQPCSVVTKLCSANKTLQCVNKTATKSSNYQVPHHLAV